MTHYADKDIREGREMAFGCFSLVGLAVAAVAIVVGLTATIIKVWI